MPTRVSSKPASYTFNSGTRFGANMQAGWIFIDSDISGSSVTDVTGNSRTLTLQGTTAAEATDATHGKCLRSDGSNGASLVPPAAWDTLEDYTVLFGVKIEVDQIAGLESLFELENSASAFDSLSITTNTNENILARFEDSDSSNVDLTMVDGFLNESGNWATLAATCDGSTGDINFYYIIDGEATLVESLSSSGISGTAANNLLLLIESWHGLLEYCYIYDTELTQANIEAVHVDPYAELGSSIFTIDSTTPATPVSGQSVVINLSNANNASGKTLTYNGHSITVDSQDINSMTVNSWPDLTSLGTRNCDYQTAYDIEATDGGDSSTISKSTDPQTGYDYFTIMGVPFPSGSIYFNDIGVANGMKHYGYVESGSIDSIASNGVVTGYTHGTIYRYKVFDTDWQTNYATATLNITGNELPIASAQASGLPPVEPGENDLPVASANASGIVHSSSSLALASAQASATPPQVNDSSFWDISPPSSRIIAFK